MPIYEYRCNECGQKFEKIQKFSDLPETECPLCDGRLEKLISAPGHFDFKGSGFYETDYKKKKD